MLQIEFLEMVPEFRTSQFTGIGHFVDQMFGLKNLFKIQPYLYGINLSKIYILSIDLIQCKKTSSTADNQIYERPYRKIFVIFR